MAFIQVSITRKSKKLLIFPKEKNEREPPKISKKKRNFKLKLSS